MKWTGIAAGAAVAALGFAASAQETASGENTSQREVRLAICAFGTAETMAPVEEWLGKTIHPGQYSAGMASLPQLGENKEHNSGSVKVEWSTAKLEVTHETDLIQAENQANRKMLNEIRMKVLNDPSRRYVPLAVDYLEAALFTESAGAVRLVSLEKADAGTRLVTVSLGDREEESKTVNDNGTLVGKKMFRQPYVCKVRDLSGNILLAFSGVGECFEATSSAVTSKTADPQRRLIEEVCRQIAAKIFAACRGELVVAVAESRPAAAPLPVANRPRIAVAPFIAKSKAVSVWGNSIDARNWLDTLVDHLSIQLVQTGSFRTLDRSFGPEIDRELNRIIGDFNASPDDICRLSRKLATDYLVVAEVMFSDVDSPGKDYVTGISLPPPSAQFAEVRFRCVHTPTTEIVVSDIVRVDSQNFYGTVETFTSGSSEWAAANIASIIQSRLDPAGFARRQAELKAAAEAAAAAAAQQPAPAPKPQGVKLGF